MRTLRWAYGGSFSPYFSVILSRNPAPDRLLLLRHVDRAEAALADGLQRVVSPLARHLFLRRCPKLFVDQREELVSSSSFTIAHLLEDPGDVWWCCRRLP